MTRKKKTIIGCSVVLSVVYLAAFVCMVSPSIRRKLFMSYDGVRHYMFVDRLAGKAYSKGNYDGIDVSRHQGVIKCKEVAKDKKIKFVYIWATMGKAHLDDFYRHNVKMARQLFPIKLL